MSVLLGVQKVELSSDGAAAMLMELLVVGHLPCLALGRGTDLFGASLSAYRQADCPSRPFSQQRQPALFHPVLVSNSAKASRLVCIFQPSSRLLACGTFASRFRWIISS